MTSTIVNDLLALATDVDNLTCDPDNARRGDLPAIKRSLNVFGQRKPIVVKRTGVDVKGRPTGIVIAGNHTYMAAVALGWREIAAIFVDDDAATAKAYALADNRTGELATWDEDQLAETLRDLSAEAFDMTSLGWSNDELAALMSTEVEPDDSADDLSDVPTPDPVTEPGDVWQIGPHRIVCGDSTDADVWRVLLEGDDDGPRLTFTSPPYNLGKVIYYGNRDVYAGGFKDDQTEDDWRAMVDTTIGHALSFGGWAVFNIQLLTTNKLGLIDLLHGRRSSIADVAIWHKTNGAPAMAERCMNTSFEFVLFMSAGQYPKRSIDVAQFSRGTIPNVHSGASAGGGNAFSDDHSATMPMHLPRWVLTNFTAPGTTVVDCFGGLGTTLLAAHELSRPARLIEIDPRYVDIALSRVQRATGLVPTRAGVEYDFSGENMGRA